MNRITAYIRQSLQEVYPPEEVKALSMLICCDMLGLDALDIYMGKDIILSECKQCELENIIFRLQKNEPIQYIRGFAEFCGRNFKVASRRRMVTGFFSSRSKSCMLWEATKRCA